MIGRHRMRGAVAAAALAAALPAIAPGEGAAATVGFETQFWDTQGLASLEDALAEIAAGGPDTTFTSTRVYYPRFVDLYETNEQLGDFLHDDAATLDLSWEDTALAGSVFRFHGWLDLAPGTNSFSVFSDDGFRLSIGGQEIGRASNTAPATTDMTVDVAGGATTFELIYYVNVGDAGLRLTANGQVVDGSMAVPAPVPLPGALTLSLGGLAALAALRLGRTARPTA